MIRTIPKTGGVPRTSEEYIPMYRTVASCNFTSQIAATSLIALQYNILSVTKRFTAYETMGNLFEAVSKDSLEQSVTDHIRGVLQEMVIAIVTLRIER